MEVQALLDSGSAAPNGRPSALDLGRISAADAGDAGGAAPSEPWRRARSVAGLALSAVALLGGASLTTSSSRGRWSSGVPASSSSASLRASASAAAAAVAAADAAQSSPDIWFEGDADCGSRDLMKLTCILKLGVKWPDARCVCGVGPSLSLSLSFSFS